MVAALRVRRMCGAAAAVAEVVHEAVVVIVVARIRRARQWVLLLEAQSLALEHRLHARFGVVRRRRGDAARSARRASLASRSGEGDGHSLTGAGRRPAPGRRLPAAAVALAAGSRATHLFRCAADPITKRARLAPLVNLTIIINENGTVNLKYYEVYCTLVTNSSSEDSLLFRNWNWLFEFSVIR